MAQKEEIAARKQSLVWGAIILAIVIPAVSLVVGGALKKVRADAHQTALDLEERISVELARATRELEFRMDELDGLDQARTLLLVSNPAYYLEKEQLEGWGAYVQGLEKYTLERDFGAAGVDLSSALKALPFHSEIKFPLIDCLLYTGKYERAGVLLEELKVQIADAPSQSASTRKAESSRVLYFEALLKFHAEKSDDALKLIRRAIEIDHLVLGLAESDPRVEKALGSEEFASFVESIR